MFKKKKSVRIEPSLSTYKPTHQDIKNQLFNFFHQSGQLVPIYTKAITSTEDAAQNAHILPLAYIWNEKYTPNGLEFELSLNGLVVGAALEGFLPSGSPDFNTIRDSFMSDMAGAIQKSTVATCNAAGAPPSKVFGSQNDDP